MAILNGFQQTREVVVPWTPIEVTFVSLDGLAVSGAWNETAARLEF